MSSSPGGYTLVELEVGEPAEGMFVSRRKIGNFISWIIIVGALIALIHTLTLAAGDAELNDRVFLSTVEIVAALVLCRVIAGHDFLKMSWALLAGMVAFYFVGILATLVTHSVHPFDTNVGATLTGMAFALIWWVRATARVSSSQER